MPLLTGAHNLKDVAHNQFEDSSFESESPRLPVRSGASDVNRHAFALLCGRKEGERPKSWRAVGLCLLSPRVVCGGKAQLASLSEAAASGGGCPYCLPKSLLRS